MKKDDAIIIGFGKGGKTLAADLANHGWNVAVVERSTGMYGGTCINIGCIPTKALVHYAQVTGYRRPSTFEQYAEEFKQAILAKEKLTSLLREKNFKNLDDRETVTVYTGEASFRSPYETGETATASGYCRRRIYRAGIRFHVRRFWVEGNDLGGRGGVHPS